MLKKIMFKKISGHAVFSVALNIDRQRRNGA